MRDIKKSKFLLVLLLVFSLIAAACGGDGDNEGAEDEDDTTETTASEGEAGGTVVVAAEQEPTGLNWMQAEDNAAWTAYIMTHVWPSAVIADPNAQLVVNEDVVESMELTKEDPQTVVYKINEKATWHDGKPLSADDFIFTWTAQNGKETTGEKDEEGNDVPKFNAASNNGYEDIESVTGSDGGKTVTVVFSKAYADWKALFDPILGKHVFEAAGGGDAAKGFNEGFKVEKLPAAAAVTAHVNSAGRYKVTDYKAGQSMTLEKNEKYWGTPGKLDKIVVPFITDGSQQPAALENEEADVAFPQAQIDLIQQLQGIDGVTSDIGFGSFWEHLDFNSENVHLKDPNVRKAFAMALDREAIVERLPKQASKDAEVLNNRIFMPQHEAYEDHGKGYEKQDTAGAQKLLEQSGYAKGSDGIYAKNGAKLTLRLMYRDPNARRKQTAELVQAQLKEAGIDVQPTARPDFVFLDSGDFDIALFGWTGGTVLSSTTSIYVPDGGQNYTGVKNPKVRELFDQANVELDEAKRHDLMNQIDEALWEDMATVPLFQVPEVLAFRDVVKGPQYNGYQGPTWNADKWSVSAA